MAEQNLMNMSPAELVKALMNDNSLVSEFDRLCLWDKFVPFDWSKILSVPKFIEKAKEYSHGWVGLLSIKPELKQECGYWRKFNSSDWSELLSAQSQFADKCTEYNGWKEFDSDDWRILLSVQPQFADKCTEYKGWEKFYSSDWNLLKAQPQFWIYCPEESAHKIKEDPNKAKECKCLNKISHAEWCKILSIHPSLADKCKKWRWFDSADWRDLLSSQPQFADKCSEYNGWKKFRYRDWSNLLSSQPQFADKCPDKMYDEFSQEEWAELEAQHPNVFEEKHSLSTLRKLARD